MGLCVHPLGQRQESWRQAEGLLDSMLDTSFVFCTGLNHIVQSKSRVAWRCMLITMIQASGFLLSHFQPIWRTGQISELEMIKAMKDIDLRAFYAIGVAFLGEGIGSMCCSATFPVSPKNFRQSKNCKNCQWRNLGEKIGRAHV